MNQKRIVDVYVEHLDEKAVHRSQNKTMRANVRRALPDFDLEDSKNEQQDEYDFEDKNEGPLDEVNDMLTIEFIDYALVYGSQSVEVEVGPIEGDILECGSLDLAGVVASSSVSAAIAFESTSAQEIVGEAGVNLLEGVVDGDPNL